MRDTSLLATDELIPKWPPRTCSNVSLARAHLPDKDTLCGETRGAVSPTYGKDRTEL